MEHGTDAIHELIEDSGWSYPVKVQRLEREHALADVEIDEDGNSITVAELLENVDANQIDSRKDLDRIFDPVLEREVNSRDVGLLGKIKRAFGQS
ncbi:hypothetical protein [Halobellus sp. EA9]|uniref:hypothetical protein n=1 Tax=Halobellus sp. EA9 TaxID=3421647 RepID=UPI003EB9FE04